jgi:hypothetical protein
MKKLMLSFIFVLLVTFLSSTILTAQVWHPVNQVTVGWDDANLATGYKIFIKSVDGANVTEVGATVELSYTITFLAEGRYFLGVQSVREVDEETFHSTISWSDNPEVCFNSESFGAVYYELPDAAIGLKVE